MFTVYTGQEIDFFDENDNTYGGLIQSFNREWIIEAGEMSYEAYDYGSGGKMCFFHQTGSVRIRAKLSNSCGETDWSEPVFVEVIEPEYLLSLSPNPATDEATIELQTGQNEVVSSLKSASLTSATKCPEWSLEVYSSMQSLKTKTPKLKDKSYKLNTQGWKDGVYIVRAKIGDKIITEKLVVKH